MFIYVVKAKSLIRGFIFVCCIIIAVLILLFLTGGQDEVISVFAKTDTLPIYSVECESKKASITFDCAWGADDIESILYTLDKYNVKSSFFIVGIWAEKFPEKVKMIANAGHDIANHSYSHLRPSALSIEKISTEIDKCTAALTNITGKEVLLYRAPYGDYSQQTVNIAAAKGIYTIQWDVDSLDWKPEMTKENILSRVSERVSSGSIILFHNDTPHTQYILEDVIKTIIDKGYELVPVSELIHTGDYHVDHTGRQFEGK